MIALPMLGANPVETALTAIRNTLNSMTTTLSSITSSLGSMTSTLSSMSSTLSAVDTKASRTPRFVTVARSFNTSASTNNVFNLDVASGVGFGPVKSYTVTIYLGNLSNAPAGMDSVRHLGDVINENGVAIQTNIVAIDAHGSTQIVQQPFAAAGSFISIIRGADGLGDLPVNVNAVIETNQ